MMQILKLFHWLCNSFPDTQTWETTHFEHALLGCKSLYFGRKKVGTYPTRWTGSKLLAATCYQLLFMCEFASKRWKCRQLCESGFTREAPVCVSITYCTGVVYTDVCMCVCMCEFLNVSVCSWFEWDCGLSLL